MSSQTAITFQVLPKQQFSLSELAKLNVDSTRAYAMKRDAKCIHFHFADIDGEMQEYVYAVCGAYVWHDSLGFLDDPIPFISLVLQPENKRLTNGTFSVDGVDVRWYSTKGI